MEKTTISKSEFLIILLDQIGQLHADDSANSEDLELLITAYEDIKDRDFEQVEITPAPEGGTKFSIIED